MGIDDLLQDLLQLLLAYVEVYFQLQEVLGIASVYESQILRQDLIEDETSQSGLYRTGNVRSAPGSHMPGLLRLRS